MTEVSAPAQSTDKPEPAPLPIGASEILASITLGLTFVVTMLLSVLFAKPFQMADLQAFEDPESIGNSLGYIALLIVFTFIILFIAKKGQKWLIRLIILSAVAGTMVYVVPPFLLLVPAIPVWAAWGAGWVVGIASAVALYFHPEWYVIDSVGILVAAGAATIFGISLGLIPVLVLLVILAIYDAIAVYKTKHMLSLADSVMELRLPVLLVIPKTKGYRFRSEVSRFKDAADAKPGEAVEHDALFMGLGDLVFPSILVVSAMAFALPEWGAAPAIGAGIGTLVGYSILMATVLKGKPQAGLPLLNGGAIVGFFAGLLVATGSIVFW
jgi:presenilin-like A22 family membrane protease